MKEKKRRKIRVRSEEKKVRTKIRRDLFNSFGGKKRKTRTTSFSIEMRRFCLKFLMMVPRY